MNPNDPSSPFRKPIVFSAPEIRAIADYKIGELRVRAWSLSSAGGVDQRAHFAGNGADGTCWLEPASSLRPRQ